MLFFFFKHKTAYEMRISDWSSDVCSSDLTDGRRLGQGGGHYDRWLAAHPGARAIGLAWDEQLCEDLPHETHDIRLDAIVTPTRLYGPRSEERREGKECVRTCRTRWSPDY